MVGLQKQDALEEIFSLARLHVIGHPLSGRIKENIRKPNYSLQYLSVNSNLLDHV